MKNPTYEDRSTALKIIGDVKTVLNGNVDENNLQEKVLEHLKFALGAGSFSDCTCVGESIIFNQKGYTCYVDNHGNIKTEKDEQGLKSPFLMGLEINTQPNISLNIDYPNGIALNELFDNIGQDFYAYAYVGCLLFENLACSYIKVPPIYKENINENSEKYWAKTENHPNCYTYLFGVVIREAGIHKLPPELLQQAFYVNPLEKNKSATLSHTHAALVKETIPFSTLMPDNFHDTFDPASLIGVRHIFTQSIVKKGLLNLYNISSIKK